MEKAGHRTLPLGFRDILDTPITEEELEAVVRKELVTKLLEERISACNFLKLTETASRMTCWPYSNRCTRMVGSWNYRSMSKWCAYLRPTSQHTSGLQTNYCTELRL